MNAGGFIIVDEPAGADITQRLNDAMTTAAGEGKAVYLASSGLVSATIELKASLFGSGVHEVAIDSDIDDGSPILRRIDGDYITLSGFKVRGQAGVDIIGIELGDPASLDIPGTSVSRSTIKDVTVTRCKTGLRHRGWLNRYARFTADYCDLGIELDLQNGSDIDLILEQNKKDLRLTNSTGLSASSITMEGNAHESASEISNSKGLVIGALYIEDGGASTEPWLHIGQGAVDCYNVRIGSLFIGGSGLPPTVVKVDRVAGLRVGVVEYKVNNTITIEPAARNIDINSYRIA